MMTVKTTTKAPTKVRATASWTKQIISFSTSFAFFGLAGVLQSAFVSEQETVAQQDDVVVTEEVTAPVESSAVGSEPLPGPLQPISEDQAGAFESAESEAIASPTVVSTPAQPIEQVAVDGESGGS